MLTEIQDGTFARNWLLENQSGCVHFLAKRRIEAGSQLEGGRQGSARQDELGHESGGAVRWQSVIA